ncbi:tRNA1(Val) (adenine(37)-N6)-methyltransferase [uncultured Sunxiuqinia sp.]|uniref:tRNA1(Val) (adenine(37)-N6)-methyltransferase n=1 Tax=uncultured Sunxiuqinia sp. TaxID=1573825 RepID=UPI00374A40D9
MGRGNFFYFKQFGVRQEKAAMKVGIDGVLLGSWVRFNRVARVLDVGTGTGLLALMAAQKTNALIDAVELESDAAEEAQFNFQNSKWGKRLRLTIGDFRSFQTTEKYDHIISNPPFFENSPKSGDHKRAQARHADSLSLQELLTKAKSLLSEDARISLIVPVDKERRLKELASELSLTITRFVKVAPDETKKNHRLLVELSTNAGKFEEGELFIRQSVENDFSPAYRKLTEDFYRNF